MDPLEWTAPVEPVDGTLEAIEAFESQEFSGSPVSPDAAIAPDRVSVDRNPAPEVPLTAPEAPLTDGAFLALALANEDAGVARRDAVDAILRSFGLPPFEVTPATDDEALAWLEESGLAVLQVHGASLETLRTLNHPALLRVGGTDVEPRLLALRELDGPRASLYGLLGEDPLRVPQRELAAQWNGDAWVIWNEFEHVRPELAFGHRGSEVSWLQSALAELGYYDGETSGLFDQPTRESVRALQFGRRIPADGIAGPRTRMVLYDLLDRYDVPRLVERPPRPEDAS